MSRSSPAEVDGDLCELDPSVLKAMRGEVAKIDRTVDKLSVQRALIDNNAKVRVIRDHLFNQETQVILRKTLSWYGGYCHAQGYSKPECQKRFFFRFKIDMLSAQALKRKDAEELNGRVAEYLTSVGISC